MNTLERRVRNFWICATLGSILVFAMPELGVLIWLGVTIPFIIALFALPTLWLYLTVAAVPYVTLRNWSKRGAALMRSSQRMLSELR